MKTPNKQLNTFAAILVLIFILPFVPADRVSADIFDWFSGKGNKESSKQNFAFLNSFLAIDAQLELGDGPVYSLPVVQSSSLISLSSPTSTKPNITTRAAAVTKEMLVAASAYSSTPDQTDDSPFITAWNTNVRDGIIAANFLPFGTRIRIPDVYGDKIFVVEDRMNRRYWHKIDIWFPDRQSALEFGVKTLKIQILES